MPWEGRKKKLGYGLLEGISTQVDIMYASSIIENNNIIRMYLATQQHYLAI